MPIEFSCDACGKAYKLKDELAGRKARCGCGAVFTVPDAAPEPEGDIFGLREEEIRPPVHEAPPPVPAVTARMAKWSPADVVVVKRRGAGMRFVVYAVLMLAMIPLAVSTMHRNDFNIEKELEDTVTHHPEIAPKLEAVLEKEDASEEEIFNVLPDHKLDCAWLSRDTWQHWVYAVISSAVFSAIIIAIFPSAVHSIGKMVLVCAFTATVGIFLLLAFQYIAIWTQGTWIRGGGKLMILFYLIKFIGFSYSAALDPESGVLLSALGFTFGVGLCEELVKAAPVLIHYQSKATWPWQTAVVVGFISGIGFGVSEGITYSSDYYNGVLGGEIYLVRFVSCVALHAVWSGAAAVFAYRQQASLQSAEGFFDSLLWWVAIISVPMVLHGFYDTLLKKDHEGWALFTALLSFLWLILLIERTLSDYGHEDEQDDAVMARA